MVKKAEWAIENSKEWYTPAEYAEVRRLMDADLADTRKQLDDQLKPIDDGWTKYSTGKDSLPRLLLPIKLQMVLICSLTSVISKLQLDLSLFLFRLQLVVCLECPQQL